MKYIKHIERLQKLNKLIEQQRTGSPTELANRLGISRSKMYEILDEIRSLGKRIKYDRSLESFYYTDHAKLDIKFSLKLITTNEIAKINGGMQFFSPVLFSGRSKNTLVSTKGLERIQLGYKNYKL